MRNTLMAEMSYPPPPPPPMGGKSRKTLVVSLLIVLVVVSAIVLAYLATGGFAFNPGNTNPSPNPSNTGYPTNQPTTTPTESAHSSSSATPPHSASPSHTPTPSVSPSAATTATPQPTSNGDNNGAAYGNFRDGAWAQYSYKFYDDQTGEQIVDSTMKYSISSGTYSGAACWLLTMEQQTLGDYPVNSTMVEYMRKSDMRGIHVKNYMNGFLVAEYDLNATTTDPGDGSIDPNLIIKYETVTVPAGTFNDCGKATSTQDTKTIDVWGHQNVPVFGLVKMTQREGSALLILQELLAYGG